MDVNPVTEGHTLVILKTRQLRTHRHLPAGRGGDGGAAGQEVFHSHLHVFGRYADDGFAVTREPAPEGRMTPVAAAEKFRGLLQA